MIAKRLEAILERSDPRFESEMVQRFQKLRDYGLFPRTRGKNADQLNYEQIAYGIFSMVSEKPGFAGVMATVLRDLRPIGGTDASFFGAQTLTDAITILLTNPNALASIQEVRLSESEFFTNSNGRGAIVYKSDLNQRPTYFVHREAYTLMQRGAETTYEPQHSISAAITELVIQPRLFESLVRALEDEARYARASA